jgi:hypothetical protein
VQASDIERGSVIEVDGAMIYTTELQVQSASSRSGHSLYKVRRRNVFTCQKLRGSFKGGEPVGIELPSAVTLEIVECAPAMKAASASARSQPAALATGLVVLVPEYLAQGETIKVNAVTGAFMSRA